MPDRWRLGTRNPYTVYRVADGAHDADHAREHLVTAFRREEDARRAVDAVNAQGQALPLNVLEERSRDVARALGDAVEDDDVPRWNNLMTRVRRAASQPTTPPACDRPDTDGAAARLAEALLHIDRNGCTNYTGGARCLDEGSGRTRDAEYTAEKWCDACVARDAVYPSGGSRRHPACRPRPGRACAGAGSS